VSANLRTVQLSDSDEFTTLAIEVTADGSRAEIAALGPLSDVFTCLRLTGDERRALAMALLLPGELVKGERSKAKRTVRRVAVDGKALLP